MTLVSFSTRKQRNNELKEKYCETLRASAACAEFDAFILILHSEGQEVFFALSQQKCIQIPLRDE